MREIRTLRATWRGLETWCGSGLPGHTGAPALDPTWESPEVKVLRGTRHSLPKCDVRTTSALPLIATTSRTSRHFAFVPFSTESGLVGHVRVTPNSDRNAYISKGRRKNGLTPASY